MSVKERDPFARPIKKNVAPAMDGEVSDREDSYTPPSIMDDAVTPSGMAKVGYPKEEVSSSHASTSLDSVLQDFDTHTPPVKEPLDEGRAAIAKSFEDKEEKPKFTNDELKPILDSILRRGYAAIDVHIGNIDIILRSHYTWEDNMVLQMLDESSKKANLNLSLDFNRQLYSLAASLVVYDGQKFPPLKSGTKEELRKSMDDRIACLLEMPNLIFSHVMDENAKFAQKMAAIAEDFDKVIKSF